MPNVGDLHTVDVCSPDFTHGCIGSSDSYLNEKVRPNLL